MSRKKWVVNSYNKEMVSTLAEELNISPYSALIVSMRGINNVEDARSFFGMCEAKSVDPMLFPDMKKAVERIHKALDEFERIAVYGDYDADGVTATALMYSYLEMQGADVVYTVPDRQIDGYGLSKNAVEQMHEMGTKLIVTVDNGISAIEQAKYISELGMELIVTDHHLPSEELPQAIAVVDPHRSDSKLEFKEYAGVGVAYKLICALEGEENDITNSFLDLVTIGTIGDVMPLTGDNRDIVRAGIKMLEDSERVGIQALRRVAGLSSKELNAITVAFGLVPRINAAGRIGSAKRAISLLLSDDYEETMDIANDINDDNIQRQKIEQEIFAQAVAQIDANPERKYDSVIVVDGYEWHEGVIGIVASRLVERFGKPSIVISKDGETGKGSGRSIEGFNLYEAIASCDDILTHFGGHKLAAGLGLDCDRIDEFRRAINYYSDSIEMPFPIQYIDFKINPAFVNIELLNVLSELEPFGTGNPQPVFGLYNMTLVDVQPVGEGKHLKLTLRRDNTTVYAMKFRTTQLEFPFEKGDCVDVAVTIDSNEYMGQKRISIYVKNIRLHNFDEEDLLDGIKQFSAVMRGKSEKVDKSKVLPDRNSVGDVYKFVRSRGRWLSDIEMLCYRMGRPASDYAKTAVSIEALIQLGTLSRDADGNIILPEESQKVNLDDAPVLKKIKGI